MNIHHVMSDGWSMGVLVKEVTALYEGYRGGERAELPALPVQYADYAVWQREWLEGEVLQEQIELLEGATSSRPRAGAADRQAEARYATHRGATLHLSFSRS